jgi:SAM-dependent methyltransferase
LLKLSDDELLGEWQKSRDDITKGSEFSHRGWYHALYSSGMRGKRILDVGSGFGIDSLTFAQHGAQVTFLDIAESNLSVIRRLCDLLGLADVSFFLLRDVPSLCTLDDGYDFIMAMGSLHHAPVDVIRPEVQELLKHLKAGGRWLQLAYPKSRWIRDGCVPFDIWGEITDGAGTPWAEWYDLPKLLELLAPAHFELVLCQEFHGSDFIWFDLLHSPHAAGS